MGLKEQGPVTADTSQTAIAEVRRDLIKNHRALYATREFKANETMVSFGSSKIHAKPNYLTIQLSDTEHIELSPVYLECINHSCDPNCFFDTTKRELIAIRHLSIGDEITFFYPSTEWDMDQVFQCGCGSGQCLGMIRGAKHLPASILKNYQFTDFIQQKLDSKARE